MRSLPLLGLGIGFIVMGIGLYALTLRAPKATPGLHRRAHLREEEEMRDERKKMRVAAAVVVAFGVVLILIS